MSHIFHRLPIVYVYVFVLFFARPLAQLSASLGGPQARKLAGSQARKLARSLAGAQARSLALITRPDKTRQEQDPIRQTDNQTIRHADNPTDKQRQRDRQAKTDRQTDKTEQTGCRRRRRRRRPQAIVSSRLACSRLVSSVLASALASCLFCLTCLVGFVWPCLPRLVVRGLSGRVVPSRRGSARLFSSVSYLSCVTALRARRSFEL